MTLLLKLLLVVALLYLGIRMITKPFRDVIKKAAKQQEQYQNQSTTNTNTSKTDDIGEYIDYEEIEEQ